MRFIGTMTMWIIIIIVVSVQNAAYSMITTRMCESERVAWLVYVREHTSLIMHTEVLPELQLLQGGLGKPTLNQKPARESTGGKDSLLFANLCWSCFRCFTTRAFQNYFLAHFGFFFYNLRQQKKWIQDWNLTNPPRAFETHLQRVCMSGGSEWNLLTGPKSLFWYWKL